MYCVNAKNHKHTANSEYKFCITKSFHYLVIKNKSLKTHSRHYVVDIINFQHCLTNEYNLTTIETYHQILVDVLNMTCMRHLCSTLHGVFISNVCYQTQKS